MKKSADKQNYIGRDMYRDKDTDRFDTDKKEENPQPQKQGLVNLLVEYSVELLVVIVFFFIVISTAFSYEQANPFMNVQATEKALTQLINLKF